MKKGRIILLIVLGLIFILIFGAFAVKSKLEAGLENLKSLNMEDVDLTKVKDGVYMGRYKVFPVEAEARVTVKNHKLLVIDLIKHVNGKGSPAESIIQTVIEKQSLNVDIVSGATYSSKVILKAIENALKEGIN